MNRRHFLGALSWPAAAAATGGFVAARNANALEIAAELAATIPPEFLPPRIFDGKQTATALLEAFELGALDVVASAGGNNEVIIEQASAVNEIDDLVDYLLALR